MTLRSESRRVSRAFGALVLALSPAAAAQACSDASSPERAADDAAADGALVEPEAAPGELDAGAPNDAMTGLDAVCAVGVEIRDADPEAAPDADIGCTYTQPCGLPDGSGFVILGCEFFAPTTDDAASLTSLGCRLVEGKGCAADAYAPGPNGAVTFECLDCFGGGGRRPTGLRRPRSVQAARGARTGQRARTTLPAGAYFARMAHDEGASVHAFVRMADELRRLGAPSELVDAAARSARDEVLHERMMARRARALGGAVTRPEVRSPRPRSLESIARENAVEGCVRETYGALIMRWQAAHAADPSLRRLFARIAADETRHAALSWSVARWLEPRLDARARARVAAARSRAERSLRATLASRSASALDALVGHPAREHAVALFDGMLAAV